MCQFKNLVFIEIRLFIWYTFLFHEWQICKAKAAENATNIKFQTILFPMSTSEIKEGIFGLYNLTHYYIYNLYHHTSNYKIKCSLRFSININSFSFWFQTFDDFAVVLDDPNVSLMVEVVIALDSFDSRDFNINIFAIHTYWWY